MSLPTVSTRTASSSTGNNLFNMDPNEIEKFDRPLIALTQMSNGDLRKLLFVFFSFLNRRTDFYVIPNKQDVIAGTPYSMGFKEGDAEKLLLASFRQFPLRRAPPMSKLNSSNSKSKNSNTTSLTPQPKEISPSIKKQSTQTPTESPSKTKTTAPAEVTTDKQKKGSSSSTTQPETIPASSIGNPATTKKTENQRSNTDINSTNDAFRNNNKVDSKSQETVSSSSTTTTTTNNNNNKIRYTEEGKQIPVGNGGTCKIFTWTQTLEETSIMLGVPKGTRGKELNVTMRPNSISIIKKNDRRLLDGDLIHKIRVDESTWSLEGGVLVITLEKVDKTWWETPFYIEEEEHDSDRYKIDTSLIDTKRHIDTYDDSTQAAIRKIIFDQNQEQLGKPTSDEILAQKQLGKSGDIPPLVSPDNNVDQKGNLPPGVEYINQETLDKQNTITTSSDNSSSSKVSK